MGAMKELDGELRGLHEPKRSAIGIWWITAIAGVGLLVALVAGCNQRDPYAQSDFPCHEDEALMYVPHATTVECVAIDDIPAMLEAERW